MNEEKIENNFNIWYSEKANINITDKTIMNILKRAYQAGYEQHKKEMKIRINKIKKVMNIKQ